MRFLSISLCILSAVFLITGCGGEEKTEPAKTEVQDSPVKAVAPADVDVKTANFVELMDIVEAERTRPLVVNLCATWCTEYCTPEFSVLAALHGKLAGKADMIGISLDFADNKGGHPDIDAAADGVRKIIAKHGVTYPMVVVDLGSQGWGGICAYLEVEQDIPVTVLYAADGTKLGDHKAFASADEALAWIESLTAK